MVLKRYILRTTLILTSMCSYVKVDGRAAQNQTMLIALNGQASLHLAQPLQNLDGRDMGNSKNASCLSTFWGHSATAAQTPLALHLSGWHFL